VGNQWPKLVVNSGPRFLSGPTFVAKHDFAPGDCRQSDGLLLSFFFFSVLSAARLSPLNSLSRTQTGAELIQI